MKKPDREMRTIRYEFSPSETEVFSKELAEACRIKQETESEKKSVMSQFKAKIDSQDSRIGLLSKYITTGYDWRSVECLIKKDFEKGEKYYFFQGVLVDTVRMEPDDYQLQAEL